MRLNAAVHGERRLGGARSKSHARDDASVCTRIVRVHARTFTLASRFLPPEKRRAAHALYAFCRWADDLVDSAPAARLEDVERELDRYAQRLERTLTGAPDGPVFRELAWTIDRFALPAAPLRELLDGLRRDLRPVHPATWEELGRYCEGVASSVGEACVHVFGVTGGHASYGRAVHFARTLGIAMQLTNILRDVGEDARRGRCYLPQEDLDAVGLSGSSVVAAVDAGRHAALARAPGWRALMEFEIARARALYDAAWPGHFLLQADARRCAVACSRGYAAILVAIEQLEYDSLGARARVGLANRLTVLWQAWRVGRDLVAATGEAPRVAWAHPPLDETPDVTPSAHWELRA